MTPSAFHATLAPMDRIAQWRELGAVLPRLVNEAEDDAARAFLDHLKLALTLAGVPEVHVIAHAAPDVRDPDFAISVLSGGLGEHVRAVAEAAAVLRDLARLWNSVDEDELDDPWDDFWEGIAESLPSLPEEAMVAVSEVLPAARAAVADPASTWPMVAAGETEAEILGQALDELSARAGIARADLPPVPALPDRAAMVRNDVAEAVDAVHGWLASRETWGRVLGRLAPSLCPPLP